MTYLHPVEKAEEFAKLAMERIHNDRLIPTPENYEIWFIYYCGANAELNRALDMIVSSGEAITNEQCAALYHRFLRGNRESDTVMQAGDQIKKTIEDINNAVSSVRSGAEEYNKSLEDVAENLKHEKTQEEIKAILGDVLEDTKEMMQHNNTLETLLDDSTTTMEQLRRDLEVARKEALTDALTGLANRKAFDIELQRIMAEANGGGSEVFTLIMMDIDHFKKFNDMFGHQVGDQVLKLVAKTLKDGVKGRDVTVRFGGEEFAIILPETGLEGAMKVADLLRREVAKKEVVNRSSGERLAKITLSAGVAQYTRQEPVENLIARADSALYTAKRNGRNQVASSTVTTAKKAG